MTHGITAPEIFQYEAAILAFVSTGIVIISARTASLQYKVAREKLRQDLFERRFAVFYAYQQLVLVVGGFLEGKNASSFLDKALIDRAAAHFLFGPEIGLLLDTVHEKCFRLSKQAELINTPGMYSPETFDKEKGEALAKYFADRLELIK